MARVLTLPLTVATSGAFATVTQDSAAELSQSVALLLDTRPGDRRTLEDYGLPDPLFGGVDPSIVAEVIADWEPRADPDSIELVTDGAEQIVGVHLTEET